MVILLRLLVGLFSLLFRPVRKRYRPGEMIECLVIGYGGANNTGAEARTVEAVRQMLDADPRINITLTSLDREKNLRYISEHPRLKLVQIHPIFIFSVLKLVLKCHILVLAEGSCFKDNFASALLWYFMYSAGLAIRLGVPTVAYAVDAGKMKRANRRWARKVASRIDLLMTRTQAAADFLRSIGVKREVVVTTDTAFTQPVESDIWTAEALRASGVDPEKPIVGIAFEELFWWPVNIDLWRSLRRVSRDHYKSIYYHSWKDNGREGSKAMKEAITSYSRWVRSEMGAQLVLFAMEELDLEPCMDLRKTLGFNLPVFGSNRYNASQMTALLRRLFMLITCRYHALVLSIGGGVPVIGLAHDERIETIMDELGLKNDFFINYKEDDILGKLKNMTKDLIDSRSSISQKILNSVPDYLARMEENKLHFKKLLNSQFPA